jgi:hypothetical protein
LFDRRIGPGGRKCGSKTPKYCATSVIPILILISVIVASPILGITDLGKNVKCMMLEMKNGEFPSFNDLIHY